MSRNDRGRPWQDALAAVVAGLAAMAATAAPGLWLAGAGGLPSGAFPRVLAATLVLAVGGRVELYGGAGFVAGARGGLVVVPLSVSLAGALAVGAAVLWPLRRRAVVGGGELLGRFARTAVLWLAALVLVALGARRTFEVDLLGVAPEVGFRARVAVTAAFGLLWLVVVTAAALAVSRRAPLPGVLPRWRDAVRPAASAVAGVLLLYVVLGFAVAVAVAAGGTDARRTFAVVLLGLPDLAWLALGLGLGGSWVGRVDGSLGLPMPEVLTRVLGNDRTADLDLGALAGHDGRVWWLPVVAAVALLGAGLVTARRSPDGTGHGRVALRLAAAMAVALLVVAPLTRVSAYYGLSFFGLGGTDLAGGGVLLRPRLLVLVALGAAWGLVAGFCGSAAHRRMVAGSWRRGRDGTR